MLRVDDVLGPQVVGPALPLSGPGGDVMVVGAGGVGEALVGLGGDLYEISKLERLGETKDLWGKHENMFDSGGPLKYKVEGNSRACILMKQQTSTNHAVLESRTYSRREQFMLSGALELQLILLQSRNFVGRSRVLSLLFSLSLSLSLSLPLSLPLFLHAHTHPYIAIYIHIYMYTS